MISGRDVLLAERSDHIYILTMNRVERKNSLSRELLARFDEELQTFNEDDDLWVCILTGAGDTAFCAGMDLQDFAVEASGPRPGGESRPPDQTRKPHPWVPTWKPMIAAVNGYALAGGWYMAQRCDIRIASENARFGITENRWNLAAPFAGEMDQFPTWAVACEVVLMARQLNAQRAYEIGFVNKVVPPEHLLSEAMEWAQGLCALGQEAVRGHKKLMYQGRWAPPSELFNMSRDIFYWASGGKPGVVVDATVGARAFAEKKEPDFSRMFNPPKFRCGSCGSVYVAATYNAPKAVVCCGRPVTQVDY